MGEIIPKNAGCGFPWRIYVKNQKEQVSELSPNSHDIILYDFILFVDCFRNTWQFQYHIRLPYICHVYICEPVSFVCGFQNIWQLQFHTCLLTISQNMLHV